MVFDTLESLLTKTQPYFNYVSNKWDRMHVYFFSLYNYDILSASIIVPIFFSLSENIAPHGTGTLFIEVKQDLLLVWN